MRNQQRGKAHPPAHAQQGAQRAVEGIDGKHKQQHHGNARDNVRIGQGDIVNGHAEAAGALFHAKKADSRRGAGHGGDKGGQQ
ncbi:hypothetical protein SDC9_154419 [bioreactor metagenome]|uniref:Uncharacterized protein n=1 Tax=bioreactor metagenome TaxID=1076179 RepID=A0A645F3J4_9ZZZZ